MARWDDQSGDLNRKDQGWGSALGEMGSSIYGWGKDNPLQALSLGAGAIGTGMGIWDAYQANQRVRERQKLAEQMMRMGPGAFAPNYSPDQLQAMYFRPAAQNMALAGQTDGGSFRSALADSALKAESDRLQLGNQIFQSRLGALGYGPVQGPTGNTGAFGQSLQGIMLMNALRGQAPHAPAQTQPQQPQGPATFSMMPPQQAGGFYPSQAYQTPPNAAWMSPGYMGAGSPGEGYNAAYPAPGSRDPFLGNEGY